MYFFINSSRRSLILWIELMEAIKESYFCTLGHTFNVNVNVIPHFLIFVEITTCFCCHIAYGLVVHLALV